MARSGAINLIVVDSVSALIPKAELEGDVGMPQVRWGGRATGGHEPGLPVLGACDVLLALFFSHSS